MIGTQSRVLSAVIAAIVATATVASAANHPYSRVVHDPATGVSTVDMTVSLEWSAPWVDGGTTIDNAYLEGSMREFARTLFITTEGRLRLGTVYVYPGKRFLDRVDIYVDRDGRANANPDSFGDSSGRMNDFIKFNGLQTQANIGKEMVHEGLHYLTGLLDEYREAGKACNPAEPSDPCQDDSPRMTVLSDHETYSNLSLPSDYPDEASRRTAQFRTFGVSCWEALVRNPAMDPPAVKQMFGRDRRTWQAFVGSPLPVTLMAPTAGFDQALRFVHVTGGDEIVVFLLDVRLGDETVKQAKDALSAAVGRASLGTSVAVLILPSATPAPVVDMTRIDSDAVRQQITTAIAGIMPNTEGTADLSARLDDALTLIGRSNRVDGVPASIFTVLGEGLTTTTEVAGRLRAARVATSTLSLGMDPAPAPAQFGALAAGELSIANLASETRGSFRRVTRPDQLSTDLAASVAEDDAENVAQLGEAFAETLASGESLVLEVSVSSASIDGEVAFEVDLASNPAADVRLVLRAPDATEHRPGNLSGGVAFESEPGDEVAVFTVPADYVGRAGEWRLSAEAATSLGDALALAAFSDSGLDLDVALDADLDVRVTLMGEQSMLGARVIGQLFDADGLPVGNAIPFADDGVVPDGFANDAKYSASIADPCRPAGDYELVVRADNPDGTAGYGTVAYGVEIDPREAVPNFTRFGSEWLVVETDGDPDADGACGDADNCPDVDNADQMDLDGDALGDACDACPADAANDGDVDTICGDIDNCRAMQNADQLDTDHDGRGDACNYEWGDLSLLGGPGGSVTVADAVLELRLVLGRDPVTPELLARGNIAPSILVSPGPPEIRVPAIDASGWVIDQEDLDLLRMLLLGRTTMPAPR